MGRYAKAGTTIEELKSKIDDAGGMYEVVYLDKVQDDLKKVSFDCENVTDADDEEGGFCMPGFTHGYDTLPNGVPVCWVGAGGDWEDPLAFCVYIGDKGELRAYIPKDGNAYNFKLKQAIGNWYADEDEPGWEAAQVENDEDSDLVDIEDEYEGYHLEEVKKFGIRYHFDMEKLRADAANRIGFKGN